MYKIFFENKFLIIDIKENSKKYSDFINITPLISSENDILDIITSNISKNTLYLESNNLEASYKQICSFFKEVNAGGGLVYNDNGQYLLIKRNGLWDLPKGHQEDGENIQHTAIREVMEETAIDKLTIESLIGTTDHCYFRNNQWHLKHTFWYKMKNYRKVAASPQTIENITKVEWFDKEEVLNNTKNSYASIKEIIKLAEI